MARCKRLFFPLFLIVSLAAFILLVGVLFSLSRWAKSPESLEAPLTALIKERLGTRLSFQEAKLIFTPFPVLELHKFHLDSPQEGVSALAAEETRLRLRFLPLVFGRVLPSGLSVRGAEGTFWGVPLERMEFKIQGLHPKRPASFKWKASAAGGQEILKGKGDLRFQSLGENLWRDLGFRTEVSLNPLSLNEGIGKDLLKDFPELSEAGKLTGVLYLEKLEGVSPVEGNGRFQADRLQTQTPLLAGEGSFSWNLEKGTLELRQASLQAPFGELEGMGTYKLETGEIEEGRLRGRKMLLEELVRYFPAFFSTLPLGAGLAGESEFDLTLRGTWDYLSLYANWNLTPAVLTYGKIFSKPKDFPMGFNFDFLLKGGSLLSGDFSVGIEGATVKGALAALDLATGKGELTLLTNKFDLTGWPRLLTSFAHYEMSGGAKALVSLKGDLTQIRETEKMINLTLEGVTILSQEGRGIRDATVLLDASPLSLRIKEARFVMGGSPLEIKTEIYDLREHPRGTLEIASPGLDPFALIEHLKELSSSFFPSEKPFSWENMGTTMKRFLPKPILWEDFLLTLRIEGEKIFLEDLKFRILEGSLNFQGQIERPPGTPSFSLDVQLDRIALARYLEGLGETGRILEGNLFFQGKFQGEGGTREEAARSLAGQGTLLIANGEWPALDLASPLKSLEPFQKVTLGAPASTPFSDLRARWDYKEGKFETDDLLIRSEDFWIEGKGNLSKEGVLNSRLEVYLSKFLTEQAFQSWQAGDRTEGKQLGPVPFLLVGNLTRPEPRIDEEKAKPLLEAIRTRKFKRVLREPFKTSGHPPVD